MKVFVIVLSWNSEKYISKCLDSLQKLIDKPEIVIVDNASTDTSNLLLEERELYGSMLRTLNLYRQGIIHNILLSKLPEINKPKDIKEEIKEKTKLVRFLHSVPKFMGEDLNIYGPYSSEDIAALPSKAASLLINKKRVKEIKS